MIAKGIHERGGCGFEQVTWRVVLRQGKREGAEVTGEVHQTWIKRDPLEGGGNVGKTV